MIHQVDVALWQTILVLVNQVICDFMYVDFILFYTCVYYNKELCQHLRYKACKLQYFFALLHANRFKAAMYRPKQS